MRPDDTTRLRHLVEAAASAPPAVADALRASGARPRQLELTTDVLSAALTVSN